jgi:NosR/NirI family nitrous oxide reductase transcriptional regulator
MVETRNHAHAAFWTWLYEEAIDHLFPWSGSFFKQKLGIQAAGIGLAVVVTVTWILAAAGQVAPAVAVGWWVGYSVYKVFCRRRCKPWVKEGPWWGSARRAASTVDLIFYVATKNLIIGALLFLALAMLGVLSPQS